MTTETTADFIARAAREAADRKADRDAFDAEVAAEVARFKAEGRVVARRADATGKRMTVAAAKSLAHDVVMMRRAGV